MHVAPRASYPGAWPAYLVKPEAIWLYQREEGNGVSDVSDVSDSVRDGAPLSAAEVIERLAGMPNRLEAALAALGPLEAAPGVDGWSARELAGHLGDASRYWGARMRRAVIEGRPQLAAYDQEGCVALAAYRYAQGADLARQFRAYSEPLVAFLRGLADAEWERVGVHAEMGPLTVLELARIEADHERDHIAQISALVGQSGAAGERA